MGMAFFNCFCVKWSLFSLTDAEAKLGASGAVVVFFPRVKRRVSTAHISDVDADALICVLTTIKKTE